MEESKSEPITSGGECDSAVSVVVANVSDICTSMPSRRGGRGGCSVLRKPSSDDYVQLFPLKPPPRDQKFIDVPLHGKRIIARPGKVVKVKSDASDTLFNWFTCTGKPISSEEIGHIEHEQIVDIAEQMGINCAYTGDEKQLDEHFLHVSKSVAENDERVNLKIDSAVEKRPEPSEREMKLPSVEGLEIQQAQGAQKDPAQEVTPLNTPKPQQANVRHEQLLHHVPTGSEREHEQQLHSVHILPENTLPDSQYEAQRHTAEEIASEPWIADGKEEEGSKKQSPPYAHKKSEVQKANAAATALEAQSVAELVGNPLILSQSQETAIEEEVLEQQLGVSSGTEQQRTVCCTPEIPKQDLSSSREVAEQMSNVQEAIEIPVVLNDEASNEEAKEVSITEELPVIPDIKIPAAALPEDDVIPDVISVRLRPISATSSSNNEIQALKYELLQLNHDQEKWRKETEMLQNKLGLAMTCNNQMAEKTTTLEQMNAQIAYEYKCTLIQLEKTELEVKNRYEELEIINNELADVSRNHSILEKDSEQRSFNLAELEDRERITRWDAEELRKAKLEREKEVSQLKRERTRLEVARNRLQRENLQMSAETAKLREEMSVALQELAVLRHERPRLEELIRALQGEKLDSERQLRDVKAQVLKGTVEGKVIDV